MTRTISIEQVGGNLAELLSSLSSGDEILITRDDRPLARMIPAVAAVPDCEVADDGDRLSELFDLSLEQLVERIRSTPPDPAMIRHATGSLKEALENSPPPDSDFDIDEWNRQWAEVEREMKEVTRANSAAEGLGG